MSARSLFLSAAVGLGMLAPVTAPVMAEEAPTADAVDTAKNSFPGIVNANAVFIRCGPAESYYATSKIEKNAKVTVVGIRMDWLKIIPPEGSFCYVAKAFVEKRGDGSVGRITKDAVNVRAGSTLNNLKVVPLCQLTQGTDVQIIGEQEEYFKIKPPQGAYLYVNKQFVEPDPSAAPKPIEQVAAVPPTPPQPPAPIPPVVAIPEPQTPPIATGNTPNNGTPEPLAPQPPAPQPPTPADPNTGTQVAGVPTTNPTQAAVPATNPAELAADTDKLFDKTETQFAATSSKPVEQQPIAELIAAYEQLAKADTLAPTLHRVVDSRLATLKLKADVARQLNEAHAVQASLKQRQIALQAERQELEERMAATGVATYTAVGTLQPSSLQLGTAGTLYRLTDPANGRTVIYLRSDDGKYVAYLGKFIGVKGDIANETGLSLRVITPTDATVVDPAKVNRGVASQVIPPSMLTAEASTDQRP